jgi:hypothetical protein
MVKAHFHLLAVACLFERWVAVGANLPRRVNSSNKKSSGQSDGKAAVCFTRATRLCHKLRAPPQGPAGYIP